LVIWLEIHKRFYPSRPAQGHPRGLSIQLDDRHHKIVEQNKPEKFSAEQHQIDSSQYFSEPRLSTVQRAETAVYERRQEECVNRQDLKHCIIESVCVQAYLLAKHDNRSAVPWYRPKEVNEQEDFQEANRLKVAAETNRIFEPKVAGME